MEGPDPKVLQFLAILEEYRVKCEEEGNYLEASRAYKQLGVLRKQEEKRQQKVIQARHISEKQDVQLAHNVQFNEFNKSWDKYMEEYDQMAQMYIQQMTERHALVLLEFQKQVREDLAAKPPKWSRTLLDQRRKQHINARNKNYAMAQKLKKISDMNEMKERKDMEQQQAVIFARREAKFRQQQQTELQALLKRIEYRRKEHLKQRELDTKRLLQRNRNVMAVLENKQANECNKLFAEIKKILYSNAVLQGNKPNGSTQRRSQSTNDLSSSGMVHMGTNQHNNNNTNNIPKKRTPTSTQRPVDPMQQTMNSTTNRMVSNTQTPQAGGYYKQQPSSPGYQLPNMNDDQELLAAPYIPDDTNGDEYDDMNEEEEGNFNDLVYNAEDESLYANSN